jgi:hypothetical protein
VIIARRGYAVLLGGLCCTVILASCGGSGPRKDPAAEARFISEANALCRHIRTLPRLSSQQHARLAAILAEIHTASDYLPAGKELSEAHAARRELFADASKRAKAGLVRSADFDAQFDRLQLRIYRDELTLGLSCAGQVARAAHETAHLLAKSAP